MQFDGHIAGAYLLAREITRHMNISPTKRHLLTGLGALAGALPDLDFFVYAIQKGTLTMGTDFQHHKWITHTFPFYLIPGLLVYLLARQTGKDGLANGTLVVSASVVIHLLMDMVGSGDGIMWAWPFSQRMDGIFLLNVHGNDWVQTYNAHPISWVERSIKITALFVLGYDLWKFFRGQGSRRKETQSPRL
jgi:membrane-bound metal-dependent hydrolase YbcI (DUF457 family)